MSSLEVAGAVLVGFGISLFIPRALQRRRVRKQLTAASLEHLRDRGNRWMHRSDRYERLYHDAVRTNAELLRRVGGAPVVPRALNADERAWETEVWS